MTPEIGVFELHDQSGGVRLTLDFKHGPHDWYIVKLDDGTWRGCHAYRNTIIITADFPARSDAEHWLTLCRNDVAAAIFAILDILGESDDFRALFVLGNALVAVMMATLQSGDCPECTLAPGLTALSMGCVSASTLIGSCAPAPTSDLASTVTDTARG
jgi:hypothetical protein